MLATGMKIGKNSPPIDALGAIDELNGWIGVPGTPLLSLAHVARIEESLEQMSSNLDTMKDSVLPSGVLTASFGHVARAVCRRAERRLISLIELEGTAEWAARMTTASPAKANFGISYLDRLSDLLLIASRLENGAGGRGDTS
jgi:cob(I)alamin adenosyltransferase